MKWLALLLLQSAQGAVLMLDFNNSLGETGACYKADPGNVVAVNEKNMKADFVDATIVEEAIVRMLKAGQPIDTIVISGHHGAHGEFFGGKGEKNGITAKELRGILQKYPEACKSIKNVALWGCYTGTVDAGESHWLQLCPDQKFTIGFPLQARAEKDPLNQKALGEFCRPENRRAAANARTKESLCELYQNLPLLQKLNGSISNCYNIATNLYGGKQCSSFDDLYARCSAFDPSNELKNLYEAYFNAEEGFENPPLDGADVEAVPGKSGLRKYYDQLHLWRHCADSLENSNRNYKMPSPGRVVRLVKFTQIRDNINRLNAKELEDYDRRLMDLARYAPELQRYVLGDLTYLTRKQIKDRVMGAMSALDRLYQQGVRSPATHPRALWRMANGINATLVNLDAQAQVGGNWVRCTHFSLVHAGATDPLDKSKCMVNYQTAAQQMRVQ